MKGFLKKHKKLTIFLIVIMLALLFLCGAAFLYLNDYYRASESAAAIADGSSARVKEAGIEVTDVLSGVTVYEPEDSANAGHRKYGIVFYPGAKVEYTAYAPLMYRLAREGILCVDIRMPFNLAVFDYDAADKVKGMFPEVERWYMAGHSLGGTIAAEHFSKNTDYYDGLILMAAYSTCDISDCGGRVLSVYGSEDGVIKRENYNSNRSNLPDDVKELVINGGCHAYFGDYGSQKGDGEPSITREEQMDTAVKFIVDNIK